MRCLYCGGGFEWAGHNARCGSCLNLFALQNNQLTPVRVEAPGGGFNPQFNEVFARNLGFGPPPPGAVPRPPPQQPQHNLQQGTFDLGGGHQLEVQINGKTPENYLKDKASGMIFGWILGAVMLGIVVLTVVGFGIYIYVVAKDDSSPASAAKAAAAAKWDGKSTFECGGNDVVTLTGVKAQVADTAVRASGNCTLTLVNVELTAPVGIEAGASAKVKMTGGSIKATTEAVSATANASVAFVGTNVAGKVKTLGNAKVSGAK